MLIDAFVILVMVCYNLFLKQLLPLTLCHIVDRNQLILHFLSDTTLQLLQLETFVRSPELIFSDASNSGQDIIIVLEHGLAEIPSVVVFESGLLRRLSIAEGLPRLSRDFFGPALEV